MGYKPHITNLNTLTIMNHIEQIIAANEELTLAIEAYKQDVRPMGFGGISFALEEAQEDVKEEKKKTMFEKFKALVARFIAWIKEKGKGLYDRLVKKEKEATTKADPTANEDDNVFKKFMDDAASGDAKSKALVEAVDQAIGNSKKWVAENEDFKFSCNGYIDLDLAKKYIDCVLNVFDMASKISGNELMRESVQSLEEEYDRLSAEFKKPADPSKAADLLLNPADDHIQKFSAIVKRVTPDIRNKVNNLAGSFDETSPDTLDIKQKAVNLIIRALGGSYKYGDWYIRVGSCNGLYSFFEKDTFPKLDDSKKSSLIRVSIGDKGALDAWKAAKGDATASK